MLSVVLGIVFIVYASCCFAQCQDPGPSPAAQGGAGDTSVTVGTSSTDQIQNTFDSWGTDVLGGFFDFASGVSDFFDIFDHFDIGTSTIINTTAPIDSVKIDESEWYKADAYEYGMAPDPGITFVWLKRDSPNKDADKNKPPEDKQKNQ